MLDQASPPGSRFTALAEIEGPRRAEGELYRLPHVAQFPMLFLYPCRWTRRRNGGGSDANPRHGDWRRHNRKEDL
jgi:hypothetical protein